MNVIMGAALGVMDLSKLERRLSELVFEGSKVKSFQSCEPKPFQISAGNPAAARVYRRAASLPLAALDHVLVVAIRGSHDLFTAEAVGKE
jgi:hypothetical protein